MAWLAADRNGKENIYHYKPVWNRQMRCWMAVSNMPNGKLMFSDNRHVELPKGTIKKIIGRDLTYKDGAVEI